MKNIYYFFVSTVFVGVLIVILQKLAIPLPIIIQNYVNDFLVVPIVLTICLIVVRWLKNDENYQFSIYICIYIAVLYAFIFEYILPQFHQRYTADYIDVLLYVLGGFLFYKLQNQFSSKK